MSNIISLSRFSKALLVVILIGFTKAAVANKQVETEPDYLEPTKLDLPLKWRTKIGLTTYRSTILFSNNKIIVGSNGESRSSLNDSQDGVYILNPLTGKVERQINNPASGDRDVNGVAVSSSTLFFNTDSDRLYSYNINGSQNWEFLANNDLEGAPSLTDLTGDGDLDVVVASESGTVYAVDGNTGQEIWQFQNQMESILGKYEYLSSQAFMSSPALVDINNDGVRDVLIGGRNAIFYALDGKTGKEIWKYHTESGIHASAMATELGKQLRVIIAEAYSKVSVLDVEGKLQAQYELSAPSGGIQGLFSSPVYTPQSNIAIASSWWGNSEDGLWLMPLSTTNQMLPSPIFLPENRISATPLIADILGLPGSQIIAVTENSKLMATDESGYLMATMTLPASVEATPLIADIDGDAKNELLIAAADGYLYCYETQGGGAIHWGQFRGNNRNTGTFGH